MITNLVAETVKWKVKKIVYTLLGLCTLVILILLLLLFLFIGSGEEGSYRFGSGISEFAENEIPPEFIPIYMAAEAEYGVPWNLLAAHHRIETRFSSISPMVSPVGALGHMQFMPCSWVGWGYSGCGGLGKGNIPNSNLVNPEIINRYGGYGVDANGDGRADPFDIEDAIFAAAKYLASNGAAQGDLEKAVYAYNHDMNYVREVLYYAELYAGSGMIVRGSEHFIWPVPFTTRITSPFGMRNNALGGPGTEMHSGIDIAAAGVNGKAIVAIAPGIVTFSGVRGGYGNLVIIDHGNGIESRYAHMLSPGIPANSRVRAGDTIGQVGSTGRSTGPHLHFEIRINGNPVDPMQYYKNIK